MQNPVRGIAGPALLDHLAVPGGVVAHCGKFDEVTLPSVKDCNVQLIQNRLAEARRSSPWEAQPGVKTLQEETHHDHNTQNQHGAALFAGAGTAQAELDGISTPFSPSDPGGVRPPFDTSVDTIVPCLDAALPAPPTIPTPSPQRARQLQRRRGASAPAGARTSAIPAPDPAHARRQRSADDAVRSPWLEAGR
jgi:hypothetical protein